MAVSETVNVTGELKKKLVVESEVSIPSGINIESEVSVTSETNIESEVSIPSGINADSDIKINPSGININTDNNTNDHAKLNNLDYENSGHTGFASQKKLENKVDKVDGKGLSTNDFTNELKTKLEGVEAGANKTVIDEALNDTSTNPVQNKIVKGELDGVKKNITNLENNKQDKIVSNIDEEEVIHLNDVKVIGFNKTTNKVEVGSDDYGVVIHSAEARPQAYIDGKNKEIALVEDIDAKLASLVDSAPEDLNTLNELAVALNENDDVVEALNASIGNKVDKTDLVAITNAEIDAILAS